VKKSYLLLKDVVSFEYAGFAFEGEAAISAFCFS
jgi:hypothetical protein